MTTRLHALIIGVDVYPFCRARDLTSAVNDAKLIRNWVTGALGVPQSQTTTLFNQEASRQRILKELDNLAANTAIRQDDPVLIYFAGHGSEFDAPKEWKWDVPQIQMILPADFHPDDEDPNKIVEGIYDRTMSQKLAAIAEAKGDNILVVLDCCNSGSGTRHAALRKSSKELQDEDIEGVRGLRFEGEVPVHLWKNPDDTRGSHTPESCRFHKLNSHVLLAACGPDEYAREDIGGGGGRFTKMLLRFLTEASLLDVTYEDLIMGLGKIPNQTPRCEGRHKKRYIFNKKVPSARPIHTVSYTDRTGGKIDILGVGVAHGVTQGSDFGIWRSRKEISADPLAVARVVAVKGDHATATVLKPFPLIWPTEPVAQLLRNALCRVKVHVPSRIQRMQCFQEALRGSEDREPLGTYAELCDDNTAVIGLEFIANACRIAIRTLQPKLGRKQVIDPLLPLTADSIIRAIKHISTYYHHKSRRHPDPPQVQSGSSFVSWSSLFRLNIFAMEDSDSGVDYVKTGDNCVVNGRFEARGWPEDTNYRCSRTRYGFEIENRSNLPAYAYLYNFDDVSFSIARIYEYEPTITDRSPRAILANAPVRPNSKFDVLFGSSGTPPQEMYIQNPENELELSSFYLFVSSAPIDGLSGMMEQPTLAEALEADVRAVRDSPERFPLKWDSLSVDVIVTNNGI